MRNNLFLQGDPGFEGLTGAKTAIRNVNDSQGKHHRLEMRGLQVNGSSWKAELQGNGASLNLMLLFELSNVLAGA